MLENGEYPHFAGAADDERKGEDVANAAVRSKLAAHRRAATLLLAEPFEITLRDRRQTLAREFAGLGLIDDLFQRAAHEDVAHLGITLRLAGELVQHGETAGDLVGLESPMLDGAGELLAEAGI